MKRQQRAELEAAFRRRCGIIGALQSCLCIYPLKLYPTSTQHAEDCPAHHTALELERLRAKAGAS